MYVGWLLVTSVLKMVVLQKLAEEHNRQEVSFPIALRIPAALSWAIALG